MLLILGSMLAMLISIQMNVSSVQADSTLWDMQKGMKENIAPAFGDAQEVDIREVVVNIIKAFLSLLAIIFIIYIILAGYKWMTSQGESGKVDEAKQQIQTAIIGLLIIFAAYAITSFVFTRLINAVQNN